MRDKKINDFILEKFMMKNSTIKNTFSILMSILFISIFSISSNAHFGSKGPFGGTITCTTIAGDTVYMGTSEGGVFESTSAALVGWRARPVGLKSGKVTAIAHTGLRLFAATADSGIFILNGYVGTDRYWNKINNGLTNLHITSLVAINATTLMAGTTNGLFLTTNSGSSWTAVNADLHHLDITSITKAGTRIFIAARDGGVYATDNNGASWIDFNDSNTDDIDGTNALSYNAATDQLIVLNSTGLFVTDAASTATAASFSTVTADLPTDIFIYSLSNDGTQWYAASDKGVYTSGTTEITWSAMNAGLPTTMVKTIEPFKAGLVCGTVNKGIFKMPLPFTSWTEMNVNFNSLKTTAMYTSDVAFVVAATENGVYVSTDLAANYVTANNGLIDSLNVNDLTMGESLLFAATTNGGVYLTADSGKNWSPANTGLATLNVKKLFYSNGVLYAIDANNKLFNTSIASISWTSIQSGLPTGLVLTSMAFFGNNILLGTFGQGVFIKPKTGASWSSYNNGLSNWTEIPDWNVTSVTAAGNKIYIGTDGAGVLVSDSTLASIHWSAAASTQTAITYTALMNLNGMKIQAMGAYAGYVWASYEGGLLATSDAGATWIAGGTQFNLPSFTDVKKITFVTTRVFVMTENNGLYSNALSEIPSITTGIFTAAPINNTAVTVAPNPNNGSFKLNTENVSGAITEITIYDYAGNVKDTFDGTRKQFNLNYAQGMYVVLLKTDTGAVYTQKFLVQ